METSYTANKKYIANLILAFLSTLIPLIKGFGENFVFFGVLAALFNFVITIFLWNLIPDNYWYKMNKPFTREPLRFLALPFLILYFIVIGFFFDFLVLLVS